MLFTDSHLFMTFHLLMILGQLIYKTPTMSHISNGATSKPWAWTYKSDIITWHSMT